MLQTALGVQAKLRGEREQAGGVSERTGRECCHTLVSYKPQDQNLKLRSNSFCIACQSQACTRVSATRGQRDSRSVTLL